MAKKVALMLAAMAFPMRVFPVPGGPNSSSPLGGALAPCAPSHRTITAHPRHAWRALACPEPVSVCLRSLPERRSS